MYMMSYKGLVVYMSKEATGQPSFSARIRAKLPLPSRESAQNWPKYILDLAVLVAVVLLHVFVFMATNWNADKSLVGKKAWVWGRYYTSSTLHAHQGIVDPLNPHVVSAPRYWNSLGVIMPLADEKLTDSALKGFAVLPSSPNTASNKFAQECESNEALHSVLSLKCQLQYMSNVLLYVNGNSMSILSEVSPSIYFSTLSIIFLLSTVDFVAASAEYLFEYMFQC